MLEVRRPGSTAPHPCIPRWWFWSVAFAFLADVLRWAEEADREDWSDYVASSRARDLVEAHGRRLRYLQLHPADDGVRGAAYLDSFRQLVEQVATRVEEHLYDVPVPSAAR